MESSSQEKAIMQKMNGYKYINSVKNYKDRMQGIQVIESIERISTRSIFYIEKEDKLQYGIKASIDIIDHVIIPIISKIKQKEVIDTFLKKRNELNKNKHRYKGYRSELEEIEKYIMFVGKKYMDKEQLLYAIAILGYVEGVSREKKIKALINKKKIA